jgi:hypothetical protein
MRNRMQYPKVKMVNNDLNLPWLNLGTMAIPKRNEETMKHSVSMTKVHYCHVSRFGLFPVVLAPVPAWTECVLLSTILVLYWRLISVKFWNSSCGRAIRPVTWTSHKHTMCFTPPYSRDDSRHQIQNKHALCSLWVCSMRMLNITVWLWRMRSFVSLLVVMWWMK